VYVGLWYFRVALCGEVDAPPILDTDLPVLWGCPFKIFPYK